MVTRLHAAFAEGVARSSCQGPRCCHLMTSALLRGTECWLIGSGVLERTAWIGAVPPLSRVQRTTAFGITGLIAKRPTGSIPTAVRSRVSANVHSSMLDTSKLPFRYRPTPVIVRTTSRTAAIFEVSVALRSGRRTALGEATVEAIDQALNASLAFSTGRVFLRCTRAQKLGPIFEVHCVEMRPAAAPDETVSLARRWRRCRKGTRFYVC